MTQTHSLPTDLAAFYDSAYVPFGGVKLSGNGGRYGSTFSGMSIRSGGGLLSKRSPHLFLLHIKDA